MDRFKRIDAERIRTEIEELNEKILSGSHEIEQARERLAYLEWKSDRLFPNGEIDKMLDPFAALKVRQ